MIAFNPRWSIAIFTARENIDVLTRCIRSVVAACGSTPAIVHVLVNGNPELAHEAARAGAGFSGLPSTIAIQVWHIAFGDKAHAWNEFAHRIWSTGTAFFVDGYAELRTDALSLLQEGLDAHLYALGTTGVPTSGRSASALRREMLEHGGIHGNLYAFRDSTMTLLRQRGVRLPLGLYRTDPLLGAVLAFGFDPARHQWDLKRIHVHPQATWHVEKRGIWRPRDVMAQYKRRLRQAQGALENRAVRHHLQLNKRLPELLPRTVNELINGWLEGQPAQRRSLFLRQPLTLYAARKMREARDWSDAEVPPVLVHTQA